jgi:predicted DCC family thiol-disulfide oxidoreductase YuxK
MYSVIYDGNCNLCVNLVRLLETLDQGQRFQYVSMQDQDTLATYGITSADCEAGMILLDQASPEKRWQGSDAAEEIGRLLPLGDIFVQAYRALPGAKQAGDQFYGYIRDNRYNIFGKRREVYQSQYPLCFDQSCQQETSSSHTQSVETPDW